MEITKVSCWYDSIDCFYKSLYKNNENIAAKVIFCERFSSRKPSKEGDKDYKKALLVNLHENFYQSRCIYAINRIINAEDLKFIVMKNYIGLEETDAEKHFYNDRHDFDRLYKNMMSDINNTEKKRAKKLNIDLFGIPGIQFYPLERWKYHLKLRELENKPKRWDNSDPYEFLKTIHKELQNI